MIIEQVMSSPRLTRQVFYFHGFDRRRPKYFYLWQKREAQRHAKRFGGTIQFSEMSQNRWSLLTPEVRTEFVFMDWSEIVRARFSKPFWAGMQSMIQLGFVAVRQGLFVSIARTDWAIGLLMALAFGPMLIFLMGLIFCALASPVSFALWFGFGICGFWLLHRFDRYFGVFYAVNIAWAARRMALNDNPEMQARLTEFSDLIGAANADEILVVGHSVGAALALQALETSPENASLVTVGQSIPLVSFQKEATAERTALEAMKSRGRLWVDISAGRDPLGFSGFDPSVGGARCYSAHFRRGFGHEKVNALKWRGFDMHFLYFLSPERKVAGWNWIDVLTGPQTLKERFSDAPQLDGRGQRRLQP